MAASTLSKMRILITNDDSVHANGIKVLERKIDGEVFNNMAFKQKTCFVAQLAV